MFYIVATATEVSYVCRAGYRVINPHLFRGARDPRGARPPPKKRGKKENKKRKEKKERETVLSLLIY